MPIEDRIAAVATEIARARGLDPSGVASILGPAPLARSERDVASVDSLGAMYERARARVTGTDGRKRDGAFYTPPGLVAPTVRRTLEPLDSCAAVCDPAAGGGAFLLAAVRMLAGAGAGVRTRREALDRVFGVDLDEGAVRVTRLALWLETADPDLDPVVLEAHVRHGDACFGAWRPTMDRESSDAFCARWRPDSRPFHWRLEFPTVFARGGFDAVVGNPPWNIRKPNSREFFAAADPGFAMLTKQDAEIAQRRLLERDPDLARRWRAELEDRAAFGCFVREAASPFHRQGRGDLNDYKLFAELAWELVREGGRLGLVVPSGFYTDAGCRELREMLLEGGAWEWLFAFENRRKVFPIDSRFKFAAIVAQKGGRRSRSGGTAFLRTAFLRTDVDDWERAEQLALPLDTERIRRASPRSLAVPEVRDRRDLEVLEKILASSHAFGVELDASIRYRREIDQTCDADLFRGRDAFEAEGFRPDVLGRWVDAAGRVAVPLYEGRMIGAYDYSAKGWVRGRGRRAEWETIDFPDKAVRPQFLLPLDDLTAADPEPHRPKIGFMAIASATNRRTMVATSLCGVACGNSVPTLRGASVLDDLAILAVLDSYAFDFVLRMRMGGTNLNRFVLAEAPMLLPGRRASLAPILTDVAALAWCHPMFESAFAAAGLAPEFATEQEDRQRRRARIDAAVAHSFGLDRADLRHILRDCEHAADELARPAFTRRLDPKGFWREDRTLAPHERLPSLVLEAFDERSWRAYSSADRAV